MQGMWWCITCVVFLLVGGSSWMKNCLLRCGFYWRCSSWVVVEQNNFTMKLYIVTHKCLWMCVGYWYVILLWLWCCTKIIYGFGCIHQSVVYLFVVVAYIKSGCAMENVCLYVCVYVYRYVYDMCICTVYFIIFQWWWRCASYLD